MPVEHLEPARLPAVRLAHPAGCRPGGCRCAWASLSGSAARRRQPAWLSDRSAAIQREALIDQIAALDDEFAEGKIDEINYKAKRAKLKEKLVKLMEEE